MDHSCILCNQKADLPVELCSDCKAALLTETHRCHHCGLPLASAQKECGKCLKNPPVFDACEAMLGYTLEAANLIRQLKYNQRLNVADIMSYLMAEFLQNRKTELPEVIIPVPIHRKRLYRRGFNQTMEIAKGISKQLDLPLDFKCCQRMRASSPQASLSAVDRKKNVVGAFKMAKPIQYEHVAIFDDVMTTGSTVSEMARLLKSEGVKCVEVWCCLRAD